MKQRHVLSLCGIIFFAIFIVAKNGMLINERISFILSSDYIFYISVFFIFMGYYLSTTGKKEKGSASGDSTPGLGEKKNLIYDKNNHSDGGDYGSGGD
jgi:hypothetical protein